MNSVTALLTCLLVLSVQAQPGNKSNKCKCYSYVGRISPKLIKAEPVIHHPSIFCPQTEIIITMKSDVKKCVDPESPLGRHILKHQSKNEKKGAVSTSTVGPTATSSSTRLHATSKL